MNKNKNQQTPESSKARVLVVDDNDRVRTRLERGLRDDGYAVCVVGGNSQKLFKAAVRSAREFRPHVAVVDLRLTDNADTSDTSGIELLKKLKANSQGVKLIVYSAYLNPTIDREISEIGATWVDKSDSPQVLKRKVAELAAATSAALRSFTVRWPKNWSMQATLVKLFQPTPPESLVDDVLSQLFSRFRRLNVHHIENKETPSASPVSRGRSLVMRVTPDGARAKKIVKIAKPKRIAKEVKNYEKYVADQVLGLFHTQLEGSRSFWDIGASVYTFLGDSGEGKLQIYRDFYAQPLGIDALLSPLRFFFVEAWSINLQKTTASWSIVDQYDRLLGFEEDLKQIIRPGGLSADLITDRPDPVDWLEHNGQRFWPAQTHRGLVHGDFHADNLFTDGDHLWVVDFERTGNGPVFADFCELEVDLLTRLLPAAVKHEEFCSLSQALLFPEESNAGFVALGNEALKMLGFLRELRGLAFELTGCDNSSEYEWGALCDCIFVLGMKSTTKSPQDQALQRERAWLYAADLCSKLERGANGYHANIG